MPKGSNPGAGSTVGGVAFAILVVIKQFYMGADPEAQVDYGLAGEELAAYAEDVRGRAQRFGVRESSREARVSLGTVSAFIRGQITPGIRILRAIDRATRMISANRRRTPPVLRDSGP